MKKTKRIEKLESDLDCTIYNSIDEGNSLEKYQAKLYDQKVMLRIFSDYYYDDRFLREGIALRFLSSQKLSFKTPQIIEEWPEYRIRAIQWYEHKTLDKLESAIPIIEEMKKLNHFQSPYSLKKDLIRLLKNSEILHVAYREIFRENLDIILNGLGWDISETLVHGDFHLANLGVINGDIIVFDWEFASLGPSIYDTSYFNVFHRIEPSKDWLIPWHALATASITHWYLNDDYFSPKDAVEWIERLQFIVNKI